MKSMFTSLCLALCLGFLAFSATPSLSDSNTKNPLQSVRKPQAVDGAKLLEAPKQLPTLNDLKRAKGNQVSRYDTSNCGNASKPMTCCSYQSGDEGSSCEVFMALCTVHGGTPSGTAGGAVCDGL